MTTLKIYAFSHEIDCPAFVDALDVAKTKRLGTLRLSKFHCSCRTCKRRVLSCQLPGRSQHSANFDHAWASITKRAYVLLADLEGVGLTRFCYAPFWRQHDMLTSARSLILPRHTYARGILPCAYFLDVPVSDPVRPDTPAINVTKT